MDAYGLNVHCERNVPLPLPIATNHPDPPARYATSKPSHPTIADRKPPPCQPEAIPLPTGSHALADRQATASVPP
jgi:hypothetical protein